MKIYELSMIIIIVVVGICVGADLLSTIWLGKDNPIEEPAEKIIKEETGIDIDLTLTSKETRT